MFINNIKKIAIIGHGGFSKEIACNLAKGSYNFFINKKYINKENKNFVYELENIDINKYKVLIAIGDPKIRKSIVNELPACTEYYTYIDKYAKILDKENVNIGKGSIITAGTVITTNIKIGDFTHINLNNTIGHDTIINNYVTTTPGVHIAGNCNIGNNCYFGSGCIVRNNINICDNVVIGMNGVVSKNIEEEGVYVGVPVKKLK
jgi:sugar O-acyltransferase (sialic acid O-acetyltransferase NeuD family)